MDFLCSLLSRGQSTLSPEWHIHKLHQQRRVNLPNAYRIHSSIHQYCVDMIWMETFCFYCTVRLGVLISIIMSMIQSVVSIIFYPIYGPAWLRTVRHYLDLDEQPNQNQLIRKILTRFDEQPNQFVMGICVLTSMHMIACALAIYGAMKLKRIYLVPYIVTKGMIVVRVLTEHIVAMIIMKKLVNLGALIGITLAGGFFVLFIGYSWAAVVALFQMIVLINSQKYKDLYGEDPMAPRRRTNVLLGGDTIESVKIFITPNNHEISALKRKLLIEEQQQKRFARNIIAVTPVDPLYRKDEEDVTNFNNWHWNELVGYRKGFK